MNSAGVIPIGYTISFLSGAFFFVCGFVVISSVARPTIHYSFLLKFIVFTVDEHGNICLAEVNELAS